MARVFYSSVSYEAVNAIDVYTSDFPLKYGGRLSSVTDIRTKDASLGKFRLTCELTPFTVTSLIETPVHKDKITATVNYRKSILKWAQTENGFIDDNGKPLAISTALTRMLSHQMRSQEDGILVGRVTDEREHPGLNVRYWSGKDPVKFVLSHENTIEDIFEECRQRQLQSLIVEGGRKTHQSFIERGLWDEIRRETAPIMVDGGTKAPHMPQEARLYSSELVDGNRIEWFRR